MKKSLKRISIIILSILMILSLFSNTLAAGAKDFTGEMSGDGVTDAKNSAVSILSSVLGVIRTAGAAIAVIILIVIACKYIIASAGDRADIKKYAVNYIIGALVLFGSSGILS
ncbi:MAG: hypothetical protein OSJ63_07870, partial [Bacilli bacterium]|nr:hypothetical protein [Bacilli bacterium]